MAVVPNSDKNLFSRLHNHVMLQGSKISSALVLNINKTKQKTIFSMNQIFLHQFCITF